VPVAVTNVVGYVSVWLPGGCPVFHIFIRITMLLLTRGTQLGGGTAIS